MSKKIENMSTKNLYLVLWILISIAALFIIAKKEKQPKCPPMDEQANKMQYIHTMGYYLAKKKEYQWVKFESIILSERRQLIKATYGKIPFI